MRHKKRYMKIERDIWRYKERWKDRKKLKVWEISEIEIYWIYNYKVRGERYIFMRDRNRGIEIEWDRRISADESLYCFPWEAFSTNNLPLFPRTTFPKSPPPSSVSGPSKPAGLSQRGNKTVVGESIISKKGKANLGSRGILFPYEWSRQ